MKNVNENLIEYLSGSAFLVNLTAPNKQSFRVKSSKIGVKMLSGNKPLDFYALVLPVPVNLFKVS